jgi:hypothetical protein
MNEPLRKAWGNRCHFEFADRFLPTDSKSVATKRNLLKQVEKLEGKFPEWSNFCQALLDRHPFSSAVKFSKTQFGMRLKKPQAG